MGKPALLASLALPRLLKHSTQLRIDFFFVFNTGIEVFAASIFCSL
jgi:hypothetical protein